MGAWKFKGQPLHPTQAEERRMDWKAEGTKNRQGLLYICSKMQKVLLIIFVGSEVGILIWFIRKDLASVESTRFQIGPVLHGITQLHDG